MQYIEYTDGVDTYRDGVRNGNWVVDVELTPTGFAGDEDTDWENIEEIIPV
jgi:hypothetical protein